MSRCPVSVIIPTFNRAILLERAVDSVFRQSAQCAEVIIVDDGSTDNTQHYLNKLTATTKIPVRIFQQENSGPAAARNLGVRQARFPCVAFLDSDDHWQKRKLEIQFQNLAANPAYQISHTREKWFRKGQHLNQKKKHIPRHGDIFDHCLQLCAVGMSTVMMKRELFNHVGFFDETLRCCEDYDMWLRISCTYPFLLIEDQLTCKEGGREDQVSFQYRQGMDQMRIYSLRKLLDSGKLDCASHQQALHEFSRKVTIFGNGCLKHDKIEKGRSYLELIPVYVKRAVQKFPRLKEHFDA